MKAVVRKDDERSEGERSCHQRSPTTLMISDKVRWFDGESQTSLPNKKEITKNDFGF